MNQGKSTSVILLPLIGLGILFYIRSHIVIGDSSIPREVHKKQITGKTITLIEAQEIDRPHSSLTDDHLTAPKGSRETRPLEGVQFNEKLFQFCKEKIKEAGPDTEAHANELLNSSDPDDRIAGAALHAENRSLSKETLQTLANDPEPLVPLQILGYLADMGNTALADMLSKSLVQRNLQPDEIANLIHSGEVIESGARAALKFLHSTSEPETVIDLHGEISSNSALDYAVRLQSLRLLRDHQTYPEFLESIRELQTNSSNESDWSEGLDYLFTRLNGPEVLQTELETLSSNSVDIQFSRDHARKLEDLAQEIEIVLLIDDLPIAHGTGSHLQERLKSLSGGAEYMGNEFQLRRLASLARALQVEESTRGVTTIYPLTPPGVQPFPPTQAR